MTASRTFRARKMQDKGGYAAFRGKNANNLHTSSPLLGVTLIILQALAAGGLVGVIIFLILQS